MMQKAVRLRDGFLLEEGKLYNWSGYASNLYTNYKWRNHKTKVVSVYGDELVLYDYADNTRHKYTVEHLDKMRSSFTSRKWYHFF